MPVTAQQSAGTRAVDDHATPSVGMYNGECFIFYSSRTGVQRHDHKHGHNAVRSERAK